MDNDGVMVSYSAKELLEKLDSKIDKGFSKLFAEQDELKSRVTVLEHDKEAKSQGRSRFQEWVVLICTVVLAVGASVGIGTALHG